MSPSLSILLCLEYFYMLIKSEILCSFNFLKDKNKIKKNRLWAYNICQCSYDFLYLVDANISAVSILLVIVVVFLF